MKSKLSVNTKFIILAENFGKWRPYLELYLGGGRNFIGAAAPLEPPLDASIPRQTQKGEIITFCTPSDGA